MVKGFQYIAVITDSKSGMPFNRLVKIMLRKNAFVTAFKPFNLKIGRASCRERV